MKPIHDSVVTITGGTGSFGSTIVRDLLNQGVPEVRVFSRDESKQDQMRHDLQDKRVRFYIGDVRNPKSVKNVVRGTDLIFHAAALKQVPSCEFFPLEAVATNIQGSANVLHEAIEEKVSAVVCLSTDKAVYPINAMGMSKALMEKTAFSISRDYLDSDTRIAVTRYGNVMASRGSVIPLFIKQLKQGQPLTLTDGRMTRFLMHLNESVDLVKYAFQNSEQGDLFVKKAPASTMADLAQALIELFGMKDHPVVEIGTRHGEKLYESLLSSEEMIKAEDRGEYYRVALDSRDLDYSGYTVEGDTRLSDVEPYTSHNAYRLSIAEIKELLLGLSIVKEAL
jgi:UDP-N-acetylglucosamine 4,6-dehydratase/5-epimerase